MKKLLFGILSMILINTVALAGVSNIKGNGTMDGVLSFKIVCTSGSSHIIYKKNGSWYKGDTGHMGDKYNSWKMSEIANYICK